MKDLGTEVAEFVREGMDRGDELPASWLTNLVIKNHPGISGSDSEWYTACAYDAVRSAVRSALQRYKLKPEVEPDKQTLLPGFKRLQRYYLVEREGEAVAISIDAMTRKEWLAKIRELQTMGHGCFEHADELRRYFAHSADGTA